MKNKISIRRIIGEEREKMLKELALPISDTADSIKGKPPQIINGNTYIYGVCPKCGGRYVPAEGLFVEPNFYNEPIYRCLDCGYEHLLCTVQAQA